MVRKTYTPEQIINKLRDELLNRVIFTMLTKVRILIEPWRRNIIRYILIVPAISVTGTRCYSDCDMKSEIIIGGR
jgi:hypothetical protein